MNFKQLGDYAKVQGGYAYKSKDFSDTGIPVLKIKNVGKGNLIYSEVSYVNESFIDTTSSFVTKEGDVLISMTGSNINQPDSMVGRVARVSKDDPISLINQRVGRIIITDEEAVDLRFLYYILSQYEVQYYLVSNATGSANQVNINGKLIESIKVPDYNLNTQKKIAHILSTLDDKIELNRKMNQTLEEMAQALFKSWFVDFDPVHLKAGCKSDAELERGARELGISKEVLELFPSEFEESELGMIPEGWEVKKFGDIVTPKKGKSITKKKVVEGNVPVVAGGLTPAYYHNQHNVEAPVITISASGANAGYVNLYNENIWASDCSYINFTNSKYVFTHYIYLKLKQSEITWMQQGAAQPHIYPSHLMRLDIIDCGVKLWDYYETTVTPMFKKIAINESEIQTLQKTRDTLLPKLLSGELDVSNIDIEVR